MFRSLVLAPKSGFTGSKVSGHLTDRRVPLRKSYDSHFQLANRSRRAIFLNLPTEVRGIASTKTKASGTCHLAKDLARKQRNSSAVARKPSFNTIAASGRSCHFG